MGWRDFQDSPLQEFKEFKESINETIGTTKQEFKEFKESMPVPTPLIPFIPLIPSVSLPEMGGAPASPAPKGDISNATPALKFEQSGDPVSCPYWFRVCWSVGMHQEQCTRDTDCRVHKFLKRQDEASSQENVDERNQAANSNRRRSPGGSK
jgi:hypothetical protein